MFSTVCVMTSAKTPLSTSSTQSFTLKKSLRSSGIMPSAAAMASDTPGASKTVLRMGVPMSIQSILSMVSLACVCESAKYLLTSSE